MSKKHGDVDEIKAKLRHLKSDVYDISATVQALNARAAQLNQEIANLNQALGRADSGSKIKEAAEKAVKQKAEK
jgi:outer membrane murein-binding lipoprotein Lpp